MILDLSIVYKSGLKFCSAQVSKVFSTVAKYLDTATVKVSNKFYTTTLPADMIFTK